MTLLGEILKFGLVLFPCLWWGYKTKMIVNKYIKSGTVIWGANMHLGELFNNETLAIVPAVCQGVLIGAAYCIIVILIVSLIAAVHITRILIAASVILYLTVFVWLVRRERRMQQVVNKLS